MDFCGSDGMFHLKQYLPEMWQDEKIHLLPESWIGITSTDCGLHRSFRYPFSGRRYPRAIFLHALCVSLEKSAMIPANFELVEKIHYLTFRNVQIPSLIYHKHFTNKLFCQEDVPGLSCFGDRKSYSTNCAYTPEYLRNGIIIPESGINIPRIFKIY
jgi:hypothetical protein